ncbi:MAG: sarcosine oxidase subunit gamma [Gammaproteobacteria bacterium]
MIYDVSIETLDRYCVFDLKGTRTDMASRLAGLAITLPESANTLSRSGDIVSCWIGPTQWILLAPETTGHELVRKLQPNVSDAKTSVVEISDMLQFFAVHGRDADEVLSVCCPLDTHPTAFPKNAVTFTELSGTKALLLRDTDGFQFAVDRSYADFIDDILHRILGTPLPIDHAGRTPGEIC